MCDWPQKEENKDEKKKHSSSDDKKDSDKKESDKDKKGPSEDTSCPTNCDNLCAGKHGVYTDPCENK